MVPPLNIRRISVKPVLSVVGVSSRRLVSLLLAGEDLRRVLLRVQVDEVEGVLARERVDHHAAEIVLPF